MKLTRTIRLPLEAKPEDILPSLEAYTAAFNLVCKRGWQDSDSNGISLHHKTYSEAKALGLPSQLACSARVKATEALKSVQERIKQGRKANCPQSKLIPIRLDARSFSIWFPKQICTIRLVNKRIEFKFKVPKFYEPLISWKQASADLVIRDNKVFLNMVVCKDVEDPVTNGKVIGIDAGIKRTAVTSANQFFGGSVLSHTSLKYKKKRKAFQKKRHSGKRHLVKLKNKENRFTSDFLHIISKKIVLTFKAGDVVAMEDLKGIRDRRLRKNSRTMLNAWAFDRLQFLLKYKTEAIGCLVVKVDPRYTSQTCSKCGHKEKANRQTQSIFKCRKCGFSINADLNGSRNIACKGKLVAAKCGNQGLPPTSLTADELLSSANAPAVLG